MKLRHRFATWLIVLGVVPGFGASILGLSLIATRLEKSLSDELDRTVSVAVNILVDKLDDLHDTAIQLSSDPLVREVAGQFRHYSETRVDMLMKLGEHSLSDDRINYVLYGLSSRGKWTPLVKSGGLYGTSLEGSPLAIDPKPILKTARQYRNFLDYRIGRGTDGSKGEVLYLVAGAPVLDESYNLVGAIILEYPLDDSFCKDLKILLGADITIVAVPRGVMLSRQVFTSFPATVVSPMDKLSRYWRGTLRTPVISFKRNGRYYSSKLVHLKDASGRDTALLMVSGDFTRLHEGRKGAIGAMIFLSIIASLVVILLGMKVSQQWVKPLLKVAEDAWHQAEEQDPTVSREPGTDEIDELKKAIGMMVHVLNRRRKLLASKISEISTLHEIGLSIRKERSVRGVAEQAFEELSSIFSAEKGMFMLGEFEPKDASLAEVQIQSQGSREASDHQGMLDTFLPVVSKGEMSECITVKEERQFTEFLLGVIDSDMPVVTDMECRGVSGSALCAVLRYGGQPIGIICLWRRDAFSEEHVRVLMATLDIIAAGLVHAKL